MFADAYDDTQVLRATRRWLERAVIGLNLCPFAKAVHAKGQIRYVVSRAEGADALLVELERELQQLSAADPTRIDTTLLIHPAALTDFLEYNQFLDAADACLERLELDGELQIASFHPQYRFADCDVDDITNYSNRSPFPMLHLLRESSVARAVDAFPDASRIFEANMATLRLVGHAGWAELWIDTEP